MNQINYYSLYVSNPHEYKSKIVEELAELTVAFIHHQYGKTSDSELIDEVVDVTIQLEKIMAYLEDVVGNKNAKVIMDVNYSAKKAKLLTSVLKNRQCHGSYTDK